MTSRAKRSRKHTCPVCYRPTVRASLDSNALVLLCLKHIRSQKQEYFVCLSLDSGLKLIRQRVIAIGTLDTVLAHPREVFSGPLRDRAKAVIIAHNHPSGIAQPSDKDLDTTQQLVAAGQILGVSLRDHLIVTSTAYYSFRKNGLII
jgi:DNA repair protein RadC